MSESDRIQVTGLFISAAILASCLWIGAQLKQQYPEREALHIQAQEPYQAKVYEDGSYVVQYNESQETETGCLEWGLCND